MLSIGSFKSSEKCSALHFIPPRYHISGCPVIIFPEDQNSVVPGRTYQFSWAAARDVTYAVGNTVHCVGYAIGFVDVTDQERMPDDILVLSEDVEVRSQGKLADRLPADIRERLLAMAG